MPSSGAISSRRWMLPPTTNIDTDECVLVSRCLVKSSNNYRGSWVKCPPSCHVNIFAISPFVHCLRPFDRGSGLKSSSELIISLSCWSLLDTSVLIFVCRGFVVSSGFSFCRGRSVFRTNEDINCLMEAFLGNELDVGSVLCRWGFYVRENDLFLEAPTHFCSNYPVC